MNYLIVYSHPNPNSFNHAIKEALAAALKERGGEVRVRDLYPINFHPVLSTRDFQYYMDGKVPDEVKTEQEHIRWADVIIFVYPIWWTGLPAMVKGYIDRVFTKGFAYDYTAEGIAGLLEGKKVFIFNTTGTPGPVYEKSGMVKSIKQTSDEGIFKFCGMELLGHKFFFAVPAITDVERKAMLEEVREIAANIG
jgi:NAD(P)H dehydrogenase (quinone)